MLVPRFPAFTPTPARALMNDNIRRSDSNIDTGTTDGVGIAGLSLAPSPTTNVPFEQVPSPREESLMLTVMAVPQTPALPPTPIPALMLIPLRTPTATRMSH